MAWTTAEGAPPATEDDCFFLPSSGKEQEKDRHYPALKILTNLRPLHTSKEVANVGDKIVAHLKTVEKVAAVVKKNLSVYGR